MLRNLLIIGLLALLLAACGGEQSEPATNDSPTDEDAAPESQANAAEAGGEYSTMESFASIEELEQRFDWNKDADGVQYMDVVVGDGSTVESGDWVVAFYTLWDGSGEMLQSNATDAPFVTNVGVGQLIKGWDAMVPGMKEGGVRRLIVPPDMAYGENPPPGIEPNATLVFELEILASGTPGESRR